MKDLFVPADLLVPREELLPDWSVVACDQYTSEPEYWDRVAARTAGVPSAAHLILPEAYLSTIDVGAAIARANAAMETCLASGVFRSFPRSYLRVTRTLASGRVRRGLVGAVDLTRYDYAPGSVSPVRATEKTVLERIPPRVAMRRGAALELPHVLLLAEDPADRLGAFFAAAEDRLPTVYDFDLMENGGRVTGRLVSGADAEALSAVLDGLTDGDIGIAVGDGNHSLAAAKAWFEELRGRLGPEAAARHPARWALAELECLEDPGIVFEPIHRLARCDADALLAFLRARALPFAPVPFIAGGTRGTVCVCREADELPAAGLQRLLDEFAGTAPLALDYIHGDETLVRLAAAPETVGFLLPPFPKDRLLPTVSRDGTLPRKAFSMGEAADKRFYLEARRIR